MFSADIFIEFRIAKGCGLCQFIFQRILVESVCLLTECLETSDAVVVCIMQGPENAIFPRDSPQSRVVKLHNSSPYPYPQNPIENHLKKWKSFDRLLFLVWEDMEVLIELKWPLEILKMSVLWTPISPFESSVLDLVFDWIFEPSMNSYW